jgi:hypothetical protein
MLLAAGLHRLQRRHILGHRHHLRTAHLLDQGVAFLMVAVGVVAKQDLEIRELEAEVGDRLLDHRHIALIGAVDEDISLRRHDEERAQRLRPHIIDVADDLVRRELGRLVRRRAHVACQYGPRRIGLPPDGDRRMIGRRWILCEARACACAEDDRPKEACEQPQPEISLHRTLRITWHPAGTIVTPLCSGH